MAHRGIITGLFAEYSDDHRRIVLLNPTVLFVDALVCVGGCRERLSLNVLGSVPV